MVREGGPSTPLGPSASHPNGMKRAGVLSGTTHRKITLRHMDAAQSANDQARPEL